MRRQRLVAAAVVLYGTASLLALAWLALRQGSRGLPAALLGERPLLGALLGLGAGLAACGVSRLLSLVLPVARRAEAAFERLIGPLTTADCAVLAASSALGEELVFRGAVQPALGLVATALLFGLVHVPPTRDLAAWPLFAAAAGLLFGWLAQRTGGLLAPFLAHATINALNLRYLTPRPEDVPPASDADPPIMGLA